MINTITMIGQDTCFKKTAELKDLHRVNLIYGLNGAGKSTLSNFLYEYPEVSEKYKECKVYGIKDDEKILVYNQEFIQKNFYEVENQKGIFSLSQENKEALSAINTSNIKLEELKKQQEEKIEEKTKCEEKQQKNRDGAKDEIWKIKKDYTGGDRILECCFEGKGVKGNSDKLFDFLIKIPQPPEEPRKLIEIKEDIQLYSDDTLIELPKFPVPDYSGFNYEQNALFSKVIVGNINSTVSDVITKLNNSDWVKAGLIYLPEEGEEVGQCPFCQKQTITPELAKTLKNYFDESYNADIKELEDILVSYENENSKIVNIEIKKEHPAFSYKEKIEKTILLLKNGIKDNIQKIKNKINTASLPISLISTARLFNDLKEIINEVNVIIERYNDKIKQREENLEKCKSEFWDRMRFEYNATITAFQTVEKGLVEKGKEINGTLEQIRTKIDEQSQIIKTNQALTINIDNAIENINAGLMDLGIDDFSIKKKSENLYTIIRGENEEPVFKSLSEGEKMVISFLYFIELCKGKGSAEEITKKKIIVIDDPISSLSHIYVFNIGRLIQNEFIRSKNYEQVFILSHSLYFLYELIDIKKENREKHDEQMYRLSRNNEGSQFIEMKYEEIQNDYHSYWLIVRDVNQTPALVANCMRNIIDYFFNFVEKKDLNNVFQQKELKDTRFQAFMRYINRESHSLGQNIFDIKEFDYSVFSEAFRLVFVLSGYEEHYNKMMNI